MPLDYTMRRLIDTITPPLHTRPTVNLLLELEQKLNSQAEVASERTKTPTDLKKCRR